MNDGPIGEVIRSSTTRFEAVCHEVFESPRFGSFVKVETKDATVYGVVANVQTESFDSQRRPVAFGMPWEQLSREQPQLVELLQTGFDTAVIGFTDATGLHHYLPPHPPRVHDAVKACDPTEVAAVTDSLDFVRTLSRIDIGLTEELLAASIREAALSRGRDAKFLSEASRVVADLYKDDYDRAMAIVRRLS